MSTQSSRRPSASGRSISVRTENLTRIYGSGPAQVIALDNVDLTFPAGQFTAVMGPSGSGKSTLLHCAAGLDKPTLGAVYFGDRKISDLPEAKLTELRRERVGFIFQSYNLIPSLTVQENIVLPLLIANHPVEDSWLDAVIAITSLQAWVDQTPAKLSGGQRQRVAWARALINKPDIIFADEPTGNLDSVASEELLEFLQLGVERLHQTVVMVTHDATAASFCNEVVFLSDGAVVGHLANPTEEAILAQITDLHEDGQYAEALPDSYESYSEIGTPEFETYLDEFFADLPTAGASSAASGSVTSPTSAPSARPDSASAPTGHPHPTPAPRQAQTPASAARPATPPPVHESQPAPTPAPTSSPRSMERPSLDPTVWSTPEPSPAPSTRPAPTPAPLREPSPAPTWLEVPAEAPIARPTPPPAATPTRPPVAPAATPTRPPVTPSEPRPHSSFGSTHARPPYAAPTPTGPDLPQPDPYVPPRHPTPPANMPSDPGPVPDSYRPVGSSSFGSAAASFAAPSADDWERAGRSVDPYGSPSGTPFGPPSGGSYLGEDFWGTSFASPTPTPAAPSSTTPNSPGPAPTPGYLPTGPGLDRPEQPIPLYDEYGNPITPPSPNPRRGI